jgi:hypothetical protein
MFSGIKIIFGVKIPQNFSRHPRHITVVNCFPESMSITNHFSTSKVELLKDKLRRYRTYWTIVNFCKKNIVEKEKNVLYICQRYHISFEIWKRKHILLFFRAISCVRKIWIFKRIWHWLLLQLFRYGYIHESWFFC